MRKGKIDIFDLASFLRAEGCTVYDNDANKIICDCPICGKRKKATFIQTGNKGTRGIAGHCYVCNAKDDEHKAKHNAEKGAPWTDWLESVYQSLYGATHAAQKPRVAKQKPDNGKGQEVNYFDLPLIAEYPYRDMDGVLWYVKERRRDSSGEKHMLFKNPFTTSKKKKWDWHKAAKGNIPPINIYNLDKMAADKQKELLVFVEGEKCADFLTAVGIMATTFSTGAGSKESYKLSVDERELLAKYSIIAVIPDNDSAGKHYLQTVQKLVPGIVHVPITSFPFDCKPKDDIADFIEFSGVTVENEAVHCSDMELIQQTKAAIEMIIGEAVRLSAQPSSRAADLVAPMAEIEQPEDTPPAEPEQSTETQYNAEIQELEAKVAASKTVQPVLGGDDIVFPHVDSKGRPLKRQYENVQAVLQAMGLCCKYNLLTHTIEVLRGDKPAYYSIDSAIAAIAAKAERAGLVMTSNNLFECLQLIADNDRYSPVGDYLRENYSKQKALGVDLTQGAEVEKLFGCLQIAENAQENIELYRTLFKKWLLNVYRVAFNYNGDFCCNGVLVLQGPQRIGKTRFLNVLSPNAAWVKDGMRLDPSKTDSVRQCTKFWIVELGELGQTLRRGKLDHLKAFLTSGTDDYRTPYARVGYTHNRFSAYLGTVNDNRFLRDDTGERRYWVIPLQNIQGTESIDIGRVWAEVAYIAEHKLYNPWLEDDECDTLNLKNDEFKKRMDEEEILLDRLDFTTGRPWRKCSLSDLAAELGIDSNRQLARLGKAIRNLQRMYPRIELPKNNRTRLYLLPPTIQSNQLLPDNLSKN